MRRHLELATSLELLIAQGRADADRVEILLINMTSAVVLATVDGAPLSGCWS